MVIVGVECGVWEIGQGGGCIGGGVVILDPCGLFVGWVGERRERFIW